MPEELRAVVSDLWEAVPRGDLRAASVKELLSRPRLRGRRESAWALEGISFEIGAGETVGLVGANGAGKTTLLQCIAGVLAPTRGTVRVGGRVIGLLQLDEGFHRELTGRENAVVAGALLGVRRDEVLERLERVAIFGGLEGALDREVRTYSSGARVRLAMSLGLELRPDLVLIDEYLAGADNSFRRRCAARLNELRHDGASAIVVSHERALLEPLCDRCLLLDDGRLMADGETSAVFHAYERASEPMGPATLSA